jgi:hypothetical protein
MCRIRLLAWKFIQYFFETNITSDLPIVNRINIDLCSLFRIFKIEMGEMAFCTSDFIIIKSNYFQNAQKGECFLDDFEARVREIDVRG